MIHALAIAESIVAPTLFRPEFLHSLDPKRTLDITQKTLNLNLKKAINEGIWSIC